jgi:hypothetical protein
MAGENLDCAISSTPTHLKVHTSFPLLLPSRLLACYKLQMPS